MIDPPTGSDVPPLPHLTGGKVQRSATKEERKENPLLYAGLFLAGSSPFFYQAGKELWMGGLGNWPSAFLPALFGGVFVFRGVVCLMVASEERKRLSGHLSPMSRGSGIDPDTSKIWPRLVLPALALPAGGLMFYYAHYCHRVLSVQVVDPIMAIPSVVAFLLVGLLLVTFSVRGLVQWTRQRKGNAG